MQRTRKFELAFTFGFRFRPYKLAPNPVVGLGFRFTFTTPILLGLQLISFGFDLQIEFRLEFVLPIQISFRLAFASAFKAWLRVRFKLAEVRFG